VQDVVGAKAVPRGVTGDERLKLRFEILQREEHRAEESAIFQVFGKVPRGVAGPSAQRMGRHRSL